MNKCTSQWEAGSERPVAARAGQCVDGFRNEKGLKMKASLLASVLLAVVTTAFAAADDDKFELVGKETHTPVSGYAGVWTELGADDSYQVLNDIFWGEKTDDPCGLYINTGHINTHTQVLDPHYMPDKPVVNKYVLGKFEITTESREPYFDASGKLQHAKRIKLDCGGNLKFVSAIANDKYVYKLNVCTTDKRNSYDNKLKGVRIWLRTLTYKDYKAGRAPELIDEPTPQEAHHTNCEEWRTPVACDPGEVATRLRVHHNDVGHRDWVTGLSLICKTVTVKEPPIKKPVPVHDEVQRPVP